MLVKILKIFTGVAVVIVSAALLWSNIQEAKANKLVREAQVAIAAGNEHLKVLTDKLKPLLNEENVRAFPSNRGDMMPKAKVVSESMEKAAEQFRIAADKYKEASDDIVDPSVKECWSLTKDSLSKLADAKDEYRKIATAWQDETLKEWDGLNFRIREALDAAKKLNAESDEFEAKATKIHDEHKDKFTK